MTIKRLELDAPIKSNFLGCWQSEELSFCDEIIELFETSSELHSSNTTTDLSVYPEDLVEQKLNSLATYTGHLKNCHVDYLKQWPFLKSVFPKMHIGPFRVRRYQAGSTSETLHSHRSSLNVLQRILSWTTYLNDVPEGGSLEFPMFGLKVRPEKGKTLIWPADWTHAHLNHPVIQGNKYVISGWLHHPDTTEE